MIVRRGRHCGVDAWPHWFRHHFSHTWLDRGDAEGDLMELNGWSSPQMLRRYGASARSARARRTYDRIMAGTRGTGCDCDAICHGSMPSTVSVDAYNPHPVHSGGRRCHTRIQ
jgi:hypothetical protein